MTVQEGILLKCIILFVGCFGSAFLCFLQFKKRRDYIAKTKNENYLIIDAKVVDYKYSHTNYGDSDSRSRKAYAPIVEYEVNGKTYRHVFFELITERRNINSKIKIAVEKNNPFNAIELTKGEEILSFVIGMIFLAIGIVAISVNITEMI